MSSPTRRAGSFRQGLTKFSHSLHPHKDGSFSPLKPSSPESVPRCCHNEEEAECLRELHEEMHKRGITLPPDMIYAGDLDATLMRFVRARKYDIDKICAMIENTIKWRKEHKIDEVLGHPMDKDKLQIIRKCKPASYIGFDKQGKPVYIDRLGKLDVKTVETAGLKEEDMIYYHIQEMEYMGRILMKEAAEKAGHTVDSVAMIMDVEGVSLSSFTPAVKSLTKKMLQLDSDHYPETNGGTWIVNASFVFSTIWRFVQPFLDQRTRQKINVCPNNAKTKAMLTETFGKELLPTFLGGEVEFEQCQTEWAAKMDATLAECARQFKETGHIDTNSIVLGGAPTPFGNGKAQAFIEKERTHSAGLNSIGPKSGALGPLLLRQHSSMDDGEEFYTPRSTLSRAGSTVSSFDAESILTPDGTSMSEPRKGMNPVELQAALQGLVKDTKQNPSVGEKAASAAHVTLETIADEASEEQRRTDDDDDERDKDLEAEHHAACKCVIQ